ncbi:hypothetical protein ID0476_06050 [Helicobacter pylori]
MEISKTQILHENINKSGCKNLKNERHVRIKDRHIIRDFIALNKESFLTATCTKSYYKNIKNIKNIKQSKIC